MWTTVPSWVVHFGVYLVVCCKLKNCRSRSMFVMFCSALETNITDPVQTATSLMGPPPVLLVHVCRPFYQWTCRLLYFSTKAGIYMILHNENKTEQRWRPRPFFISRIGFIDLLNVSAESEWENARLFMRIHMHRLGRCRPPLGLLKPTKCLRLSRSFHLTASMDIMCMLFLLLILPCSPSSSSVNPSIITLSDRGFALDRAVCAAWENLTKSIMNSEAALLE